MLADVAKSQGSLPRLRQDLRLLPGQVQSDGSPSWRIHDPVRNRFFEIGWLEFELLARWAEVSTLDQLAQRVSSETTLQPSADELRELVEFLQRNQLFIVEDSALRRGLHLRWMAGLRPWHQRLLHHYLFFRIPLVRPDRFLAATLPWARALVSRWALAALAIIALLDLILVTRQWDSFERTFLYFFNFEGLIYYAVAVTFSKLIHELAHAWTARHYGLRVPVMGVAFLVMWPMLYTDTGETWKLTDSRQRFRVAAAGIAAELALALVAALCWSLAPEGPLRSVFFLLATTTWVLTLAINLSPFMRFDGYYLLSDALNIPNLHERSGQLARRWIRVRLFGLDEPDPAGGFSARAEAALIAFALATWLYRLVLFLGIALLVYHFFFKLLGIALMAVEILWFIVHPIALEVAYLWQRRRSIRLRAAPLSATAAIALGLLWLLPLSTQVSAPALWRVASEQGVFSPTPAHLAVLAVHAGTPVKKGDLIARLDSPELQSRRERAQVRIRSLRTELSLRTTSVERLEHAGIVTQQLAESLAELESTEAEISQLTLNAEFDGVVRDIPADMIVGRWVNSRQLIARVIGEDGGVIEAYVSEDLVGGLAAGQAVRFYPRAAGRDVLHGTTRSIDRAASTQLPRLLLASTYGGDIAVSNERSRELRAHDAVYRVLIDPEPGAAPPPQVLRGHVRVESGLLATAGRFFSRMAALIVRESGF